MNLPWAGGVAFNLPQGKIRESHDKELYSFGVQSENGAVWQTIPEPTSGILLALGVAALALKRKKAA